MKKKVYAYLHTHWDREWYRNKEDFNIRLINVLDTVIAELKAGKAPFFYLDGQIIALLDYLKYRPENKDIIIDFIKNKKLAVGPYFVSADSYLVNFNSMLKNLEIGLEYSKEFNQKDFIGYMADIFGISKSAFYALELNSINKALIWRGVNPKDTSNHADFKYNSINTTWMVQGYFNDWFHADIAFDKKIEQIKKYLDKISLYSSDTLLLAIGGDHLNILKNASDVIKKANLMLDDYEIILTSPFEYFKKVKYNVQSKSNEFLDNEKTYVLKGCYSTRVYQKIKNSILQNELSRIIEPLDYFLNKNYQKNIRFAWETLIKCHAHDGICGCSIDDTSSTVDYRFLKVQNILESLRLHLSGDYKNKYNIKGNSKDKVNVINLSNNDYSIVKVKLPYVLDNSQIIEKNNEFSKNLLYDIDKIPVTEDITPIYTQLINIEKSEKFSIQTLKIKKPKKGTKVSQNSIENKNLLLKIKNKKIELIDKKTNLTYELKLIDIKDDGDSYNSAPIGQYKKLDLIKSKVEYQGDIESKLKLYFKSVELEAILDNESEFIKFRAKINNKTKNHKLQLAICSKDKIKKTISDDAIGIIERKIDPDYDIQKHIPAIRPYELKTNTFPMQNFVNANSINILTKGLNEYEISSNELKITLLRAIGTISNPKNKTRAIPAGPDLKAPDMQCLKEINEEFAILFGNYKKAFNNIDKFKENYVISDGTPEKDINKKLLTPEKDTFIYGVYKNKKISYNISNKKIELI